MATFLDRLLGRPETALTVIEPPVVKAASGPGVYDLTYLPSLSGLGKTPQKRMEAYLKAYKVGWFYKAESKISRDIASLKVTVSHEDNAGDNEEARVEPDLFAPWQSLDPIGQFLRLMERPIPSMPNYTGRQLRQKTQIRLDMAGAAFWYLEGVGNGFRTPTAIYGISPSRMTPAQDREGVLRGWILDKDKPGGGTFMPSETILPFFTASAEDDLWGVGIVEAVEAEIPLTALMAKHTADLLTTGGRLAGMLWPKDRTLTDPEFEDAKNVWRALTSTGDAAKRLLIFPEPMEYATGASTPAEIGIPELAALNRDNILTAFPISPYQLGVPMPGGLNSAATREEDRHDYWEGTIHPRVELLEETIQVGLVSRYEALVGTTFDFDIEEPNLDNASSLIEKAGAMKALISLGFEAKEVVAAVGLDGIKYNGPPPAPELPPAPGAGDGLTVSMQDADRRDTTQTQQKLVKSAISEAERVLQPATRRAQETIAGFLREQHNRISGQVRTLLENATKGADRRGSKAARANAIKADWFDVGLEDARLADLMGGIYVEVGRGGLQTVANDLNRFIRPGQIDPVISDLKEYGGERITSINEKTRDAVTNTLSEGTRRGYSIPQLIEGVPADGYAGIKGVTLDNGLPAFGDARAEMIARTETMLSYNRSTVTGYGSFGVERLVAYDGDGDAECASRSGADFTVSEALSIEDHPNGTLVWSPLLKAEKSDAVVLAEAIRDSPITVTVPPRPPMRTVIDRDGEGQMIGSHEEPV